MIVVAGPPGSGKSSVFPVAQTGVDYFNIDDRAAELNGGSFRHISPEIRAQANRECEAFIEAHIRGLKSFAVRQLSAWKPTAGLGNARGKGSVRRLGSSRLAATSTAGHELRLGR